MYEKMFQGHNESSKSPSANSCVSTESQLDRSVAYQSLGTGLEMLSIRQAGMPTVIHVGV
jgi:hypothetical protein